jgi:lipopolysaccharide exporter
VTGVAARLLERIPSGRLFRGAVTIAAGTGLAQIITLASSPIVTRLYTPADFGAFAAAASLLAILLTVTCLSYEFSIPLPESDVTAANAVALSLLATLATSFLVGLVLLLAGEPLLEALGAGVLAPYALLLAVGLFAGGVVGAMTAWAVRTKSYSHIAANRLAQSIGQAGTQIGLGILAFGPLGLLLGAVVGSIAGIGRLVMPAWRRHAAAFRQVSWSGIRATAVRYRRFPILSTPSNLLNAVALQTPQLLMVALFGAAAGGQFALAQRVIALPSTLIAGAVSQAFLGEAADVARERPDELEPLFRRTTRSLAVAALVPLVLAIALAPPLFGFVFGERWVEAGLFVAVLAPMYYLQFVTNPTAPTLDILERQDLFLAREVARLLLTGGIVAAAWALSFTALEAVAALSVAGCAAYTLNGLLSWYAIRVRARSVGRPA